ncbi:hypothetical protein EsDP_00000043 [Epichloe bromicola]|uniref:SH3 domain-containing protein n=1 Tax=Epichloe bromicola TaxID=79588 RepID=A0ABQ0CDQ8_9HYPO
MPHSHRHHHVVARDIIDEMEESSSKPSDDDEMKNNGKEPRDDSGGGGQATFIRTVYKTLEATFEGPVAGYSTLNIDQAPEPTPTPEPTPNPEPTQPQKPTREEVQPKPTPIPTPTLTPRPEVKEGASVFPSEIRQPSTSTDLDTVLAKATGKPTVSPSATVEDNLSTSTSTGTLSIAPTTTPTSQSAAPQDSGEGTSAGTKAGIAFGVLGGVFLVGLAVFLLFRRRRRQAATALEEADNEKYHRNDNPFDTMTIRSDPHAPRISLRPVTQLLPNWNIDKRASKGAGAALTPAAAAVNADGQKNGMQERTAASQSTHPANPFGSQAERIPEPASVEHGAVPPSDPFTASGPVIAAGAAAGALTRITSMRKTGPSNLVLTVPPVLGPMPPSPAGTEFSMTSVSPGSAVPQSNGAAAIAAAGGPSNSNVHRVQLDFKPSLDDEMEMKAGDLVRLLHEYDDGWALCIRLDRSQQGVVPRTCLSTRPVKPRSPQGGPRPGPPVNPSGQFPRGLPQRPMTPQGIPGPRPMSPSGRPQSPGPRPTGPPPGAPGSRPQSPMGAHRQIGGHPGVAPTTPVQSPPRGPSNGPPTGPVGRKPVPGQAY